MYVRNGFVILICQITAAYSLTCDDILEFPADKKFVLQDLQTLQPKDVIQCLAHLGKEELGENEANYLWKTIVTFYEGIPNIPENVLMLLHWVTPAITPDEYSNISLSNIDVIQNFGLNYNLKEDQLRAIAERVKEDFAGKEPEDFTYYDLNALRQILCAYNKSEIERIHPAAYREAAITIGKLQNCNSEVLSGFATLAMQPDAFGHPNSWPDDMSDTLGVVAEHLPKGIRGQFQQQGQEVST